MSKPQEAEYQHIKTGYEFHPVSYHLDNAKVADYLRAVGETSALYQDTELTPPMAVAAYVMAALFAGIVLPAGTIHVSQELDFIGTISVGDNITCHAMVLRKQDRGGLHLMTISFSVLNQNQEKVLSGKTSLVLPE